MTGTLKITVLALSLYSMGGCSTAVVVPVSTALDVVAPYRQKALALEAEGVLRQALETWKIVLALSPGDPAAHEHKEKVETRIKELVAEKIRQADQAAERKSLLEARRYYLSVLALDPGNVTAFEALRSKAKEVRVLPHSVRQGETLASIAELYYGDRSRAEVIWETNQLPPNPKLKPGLSLRIPEIPGVPFLPQRDPRSVPSPGVTPPNRPDLSPVDPAYVNPLLSDAKDALDSGDFVTALAGVDQFLATNPKNGAGLDLKKTVLYTHGRTLLDQKKYQESLQVFNQLARIAPNYQDSSILSGQAKACLVQEHYSEGIRFFRDEKLREAISRWRTVLQYEPNHAGAKKNIAQAERMLENLERQKTKR